MSATQDGPGNVQGSDGKWPETNPSASGYQEAPSPMSSGGQVSKRRSPLPVAIVVLVIVIAAGLLYYSFRKTGSPLDASTQRLIKDFNSDNLTDICTFEIGEPQKLCDLRGKMGGMPTAYTFSLKEGNKIVSGNEALVTLIGSVCAYEIGHPSQKVCLANNDPNFGLPKQGQTFALSWNNAIKSWLVFLAKLPFEAAPFEFANGSWYVVLKQQPVSPTTTTQPPSTTIVSPTTTTTQPPSTTIVSPTTTTIQPPSTTIVQPPITQAPGTSLPPSSSTTISTQNTQIPPITLPSSSTSTICFQGTCA